MVVFSRFVESELFENQVVSRSGSRDRVNEVNTATKQEATEDRRSDGIKAREIKDGCRRFAVSDWTV